MKERTAIVPIFLLALLVGTLLPAAGEEGLRPPFLLNCGPTGRDREDDREVDDDARRRWRDVSGVLRLDDVPYSPRAGYGHEGGEGFRHWFAGAAGVWGRPERDVFASGRFSPESYLFDLPAGEYVVALGFCELEEHLAGRRVFDVTVQGRTVLRGVDPFRIAGYGQSFRLARLVEVRGREGLTIGLRRGRQSRRSPFVNGIWVYPVEPRGVRSEPTTLRNVRGFGSYGMNVLFWEHPVAPAVAGYVVERRARGESVFRALTPEPVPVARWVDHDVSPESTYLYRVLTVDLRGRRGPPSRGLSLEPRDLAASSFPVYSLTVGDEELAALFRNVREDHTVRATFALGETDYPVHLRIRGAVSRFAAKLSYHVTFVEETPFGERRVIYLKAEPSDYTLQQTKLTCDVFSALGAQAGTASYVTLLLNGRYQGIYLDVERIDRAFLERKGIRGTLFRSGSFQQLGGDAGPKRGKFGTKRELPEFIRAINRVDRGEFESFLRAATDWPQLRDYLVASTVCHRSEIEANDFFYCRVAGKRWLLIPWDHNNGNFGVFGLETRRPFMPLFGQTLQGSGHWNNYWYVLPSRIFHQRALRDEYVDRLERIVRDWLVSGTVDRFIAANYRALSREIVVDPYRWPPGGDEPFHRSADDLRRFVRLHAARLLEAVRAERRRPQPPVAINEFQLGPQGGWVEIHNRSDVSVRLDGFSLGSLDRAYRPWHRFRRGERLDPGAFRVVRVEYPPRTRLVDEEDDLEWLEALERAEFEGREPPERERRSEGPAVPGGTVALVGPLRESTGEPMARDDRASRERKAREEEVKETNDAEAREREALEAAEAREREARERGAPDDADFDVEPRLVDWYFFGHTTPGFSYGRLGGGFATLKPTPGEANRGPRFEPPKLLADGGRRGHRGEPIRIFALVEASSPGRVPHGVTLHYSFGGPWREVPMAVDATSESPRFVATLQTTTVTREVSYYFVARTADGVERPAPLTAPVETYHHAINADD